MLTQDNYHCDLTHESNSSLNLFRSSVSDYYAIRVAKTAKPKPPSEEMLFGTAMHFMVFQPVEFVHRYAVAKCSTTGLWGVNPVVGNRIKIDAGTLYRMNMAYGSIAANSAALNLLDSDSGYIEKPISAVDPETGIHLKCMPDLLTRDDLMPDLKSTGPRRGKNPVAKNEFSKAILEFGYHRQMALYRHVIKLATGRTIIPVLMPVSSNVPWGSACYELDDDALAMGAEENRETLRDLAERRAKGDWSETYANKINVIGLPPWAKRKMV